MVTKKVITAALKGPHKIKYVFSILRVVLFIHLDGHGLWIILINGVKISGRKHSWYPQNKQLNSHHNNLDDE